MIRAVFLSFEMPETNDKRKVVYLLGAGATHAEMVNAVPRLASDETLQRRIGLLTSHLSARVMRSARLNANFVKDLEFLEPPRKQEPVGAAKGVTGAMNIELLISLIENSKARGWEQKARILKLLVRRDIEARLQQRKARFYLHSALLEMQQKSEDERLIGIISLNYDDVLDEAYKEVYRKTRLDYCVSLDAAARASQEVPVLKLHGSFNWRRGLTVRGRKRRIDIIPLGSNKNYLHAPYNFIWTRALEVLVECDSLRVIGCSLSQNDTHLVDLLFKAHLEKPPDKMKSFEIEIISGESAGRAIRDNYGFFPGVKTQQGESLNPFLTWLMSRADRIPADTIKGTRHLKKLKIAGLSKG